MSSLDNILTQPIYELDQTEKETLLLARFNELSEWHYQHCPEYRRICDAHGYHRHAASYADIPYLVVRLFKLLNLKSIPDENVFKTLTSSGTTGSVSRIFLDKNAAAIQSKVLVKIMQEFVGKQRLPMLLIEQPTLIQNRQGFSARGAGALGLSFLGRDHHYALDENMQPDWAVIDAFSEKYANQPVLIFGFTFMVWQFFLQPLLKSGRTLPFEQGILFHSGGWKKLEHLAVNASQFNQQCKAVTGISKVHNFYGMVEQTGSIFVSCEYGHLHTPVFSDIQIRNPKSLKLAAQGEEGLIQVMSALPESYPGHSLLTEDLGVILGEDNCPCGRKGRYFSVRGRATKAEVRGCSDTFR